MDYAKSTIADVPDFPKPGIVFKDITPMLADAKAFNEVIETLATHYRERGVTHFAGIESRGFIFAAPLAKLLNAGLILIRKPESFLGTPSRNRTNSNMGRIRLRSIKMHVAPMIRLLFLMI